MKHKPKALDVFKWQFATAQYDCVLAALTINGEACPLSAPQAAVLECLLRADGQTVSREKLRVAGWHGRHVSNSEFDQTLMQLQRLLVFETRSVVQSLDADSYRLDVAITAIHEPIPEKVAAVSAPPIVQIDTKPPRFRKIAIVAAVLLIAILITVWMPQRSVSSTALTSPLATIAVLPFVEAVDSDEAGLFGDGVAEDLLNQFMRIPGLAVIGRTSAFSFKNKDTGLDVIAKQLGASHLLSGRLRRQGQQLHLSVQLFRSGEQTPQWSQEYDAEWQDMTKVQTLIVSAVAEQLKTKPKKRSLITENAEAYAATLQAQQLMRIGTENGYARALEQYEKALALDPGYVTALIGTAGVYRRQAEVAQRPVAEGYQLARQFAEKALSFDNVNSSAMTELAWVAFNYEHDVNKALSHFQKAIELNPGNLATVANAAILLHDLGKEEQAIQLSEYVVKYDPINSRAHANLGLNYLSAGRLDEAQNSFQTALSISPKRIIMHYNLGVIALLKGEFQTALNAMQREPSENYRLMGTVMAFHSLQRTVEADTLLSELIQKYEADSAFNIAYVLAWRGDNDNAFVWLEKARNYRDPGLSEILVEPMFVKLKSDPRWLTFIRQIGLDPEQIVTLPFTVSLPN